MGCLTEFRCPHCEKLLFKGVIIDAHIEVKCRACKRVVDVGAMQHQNLICMVNPCPNRVFFDQK